MVTILVIFIFVCFHQLQAGVGVGLEREQLEPQFLIKGQKITAKLGDTVVLPCKVANLGELVDSDTVETLYKVLY